MLTGCGPDLSFGLKDMFASMDKEADQDQRLDNLAVDSGLVMSKSTYDKQVEYVDALDLQAVADEKQAVADAGTGFWQNFLWSDSWAPWDADYKAKKAQTDADAKIAKAETRYNNAKASDAIYQKSLRETGEDNAWNKDSDFLKNIGILIPIIIIIIILVFILLLRRGAPPAQPVVIQQPAPAPEPVPVPASAPETNDYDMNYEKRYKALSDMCKKVNMDPDDVLKQCGGDIDKAFLEVSLMT